MSTAYEVGGAACQRWTYTWNDDGLLATNSDDDDADGRDDERLREQVPVVVDLRVAFPARFAFTWADAR